MNRTMAPMVLVMSALLVACSSATDKAAPPAPKTSASETSATETSPSETSARVSAPAPAPVGQQSAAQLKALALATPDLPFGWAVSPPATDTSVTAPCSALTSDGSKQLPAQAETDFQQSEDGPFLQEILASGPTQQVHDVWASVQKAALACSATASGTDTTQLSAMTFTSYGDESYALQLAVNRSGVSYGEIGRAHV